MDSTEPEAMSWASAGSENANVPAATADVTAIAIFDVLFIFHSCLGPVWWTPVQTSAQLSPKLPKSASLQSSASTLPDRLIFLAVSCALEGIFFFSSFSQPTHYLR
jgi:hypothetical protein